MASHSNQLHYHRNHQRPNLKSPIKSKNHIKSDQRLILPSNLLESHPKIRLNSEPNSNKDVRLTNKMKPSQLQKQSRLDEFLKHRIRFQSQNKINTNLNHIFDRNKSCPKRPLFSNHFHLEGFNIKIHYENHLSKSPQCIVKLQNNGTVRSTKKIHRADSAESESHKKQNLKKQNEKLKQIYAKSKEKKERLEKKMEQILSHHSEENTEMNTKITNLKVKVGGKKTNMGHLFSYKNQQKMDLEVGVIAETDNENSSSNVEALEKKNTIKADLISWLSIDSNTLGD